MRATRVEHVRRRRNGAGYEGQLPRTNARGAGGRPEKDSQERLVEFFDELVQRHSVEIVDRAGAAISLLFVKADRALQRIRGIETDAMATAAPT